MKVGTISKGTEKLLSKKGGLTGKESSAAIKEGWLTKQGNYIKNWRPRWFQLKDGMLCYYKEPSVEVKPTNFFIMSGAKVVPYNKTDRSGFELIMANGEKRIMQAESESERDSWVEAINKAIDVQMKKNRSKSTQQDSLEDVFKKNVDLDGDGSQSVDSSKSSGDREKKMVPEDFNFMKVLGKGNYGKVMLATLKNDPTNKFFAVKVIKKSGLIDDESLEHVLAENRVLQQMEHPFLVKLYYSFQTSDRLYFVMEYVNGGELFFHIGRDKRFTENRVRFYAGEIILALQYLHENGVVYRDLKLENLLLDNYGHIKITDFGLCKEGIGTEDTTSTFCGTPEYLAPEILEEEHYGRSVDWWALGVVLYEMMVGKPPFGPTNNMEKLFQNILNQPVYYPSFLSEQGRSLLERLLCRDPTQRLGCGPDDGDEIIAHPFFEGIDFNKLKNKVYQPPFRPKIDGETDVRNFDREFTDLPAILTPENEDKSALLATDFQGFTYSAENPLTKN